MPSGQTIRPVAGVSKSQLRDNNIYVFNNFINMGFPAGSIPFVSQGGAAESPPKYGVKKAANVK